MKKMVMFLVVIGMLFLGVCVVMAMHHEIKIQQKSGIGKYLTDTEGKTLYWFKNDSPGKSTCSGPCLEKWPIYYRETVAVPAGMKAGEFATITRADGKKQTAFRGMPLYYWVDDKVAGQTGGQGVNKLWYVINPDNFQIK
ncbi:MAG: COG4315 family predicted lipoprotein [Syntrophales bacterium]